MSFTIRARRTDDQEALIRALSEQQPSSNYPFRWPLPIAIQEFIFRHNDEAAWVACQGPAVVGHVAVGTVDHGGLGSVFEPALDVACSSLRAVTTLFTSVQARGIGAGRALLEVAQDYVTAAGCIGVLDVVPSHERAFDMYVRHGWKVVARARPNWLPADAPDVHYLAHAPELRR